MIRITAGVVFAISCFAGITMFRGVSLGRDIDPLYVAVSISVAVISFGWLVWLGWRKEVRRR